MHIWPLLERLEKRLIENEHLFISLDSSQRCNSCGFHLQILQGYKENTEHSAYQ